MSKNVLRCRAQSNEYEVGTLVVDGLAVTFGTARRGLGGTAARPSPPRCTKCITAHSQYKASVPITVLLYNGPLLCGFNVGIKGLSYRK